MDQMARDYSGRAHFLFIYCREAHPDDFPDYPAHRSIEQKAQHARDMQARHETPRTILVDALDGDVHRQYSGCPNMSFIIDHTGRVAYKAGWTVAADIRPVLEAVVGLRGAKRKGRGPGYYREVISYW